MGERSAQNDGMTPIQETPRNLLSRRALIGLAAGAALVPVGLSGGTAQARSRVGPAPETVALPDGFRPEGIASGPGTTYYAGSMANGRIVTGDLLGGPQSVLLPPADGRAIRGLYYDDRSNLLWFVGNVSTVQWVWAINASTGAVVFGQFAPGGAFHNDLVVTDSYVYVTDSRVDRLIRVPLNPATGQPSGNISPLALGGAWPVGPAGTTNANGIRELPDGSLVLNNSRVGGLWQVDAATGVARAIPVKGVLASSAATAWRSTGPRCTTCGAATRARSPSFCSRSPEAGGRRSGPAPAATRRWTSPRPPPSRVAGSG